MKKKASLIFLGLFTTIIIAYSIMPIVGIIFSRYFTTYSYMFILLFTFIFILFARGSASLSEYLLPILPLVIWKLLVYVVTGPSIIDWGYGSLTDIAPIVIGCFLIRKKEYKIKKYFCIVIFLAFLATAIASIIGLQQYPDASRYLALAESYDDAFIRYSFMNIGGYNFVYGAVLLYPVAIYAYKERKIGLWLFIIIFVIELLLLLNAGYTTALILFMISSVFLFFRRNLSVKNVIFIIIISIILIAVFSDLLSQGLNALADIIENNDISERLRSLAGGREGIEQSDDNRIYWYRLSLNVFLESPLFGRMFGKLYVGGHSFILDSLAEYGIVGLSVLIYLYVTIYKLFYKPYSKSSGFGYILWAFLQPIVLSTVNTGMWIYALCLYIPTILAHLTNKEDREIKFSHHLLR